MNTCLGIYHHRFTDLTYLNKIIIFLIIKLPSKFVGNNNYCLNNVHVYCVIYATGGKMCY